MLTRRKLTNLTIFGELFYFIIHCCPLEAHRQTIYEDAMTLTIMTFSIMTLSIKELVCDTEHIGHFCNTQHE
jgi:hypothetical protein